MLTTVKQSVENQCSQTVLNSAIFDGWQLRTLHGQNAHPHRISSLAAHRNSICTLQLCLSADQESQVPTATASSYRQVPTAIQIQEPNFDKKALLHMQSSCNRFVLECSQVAKVTVYLHDHKAYVA